MNVVEVLRVCVCVCVCVFRRRLLQGMRAAVSKQTDQVRNLTLQNVI